MQRTLKTEVTMLKLLFSTNCVFVALAFTGDSELKELGEKQYRLIKTKSALPQHGKCWHEALKAIKGSCEQLNDHQHSLLALLLANCFLEDSGHVTYSCHLSETEGKRRECINKMTDRAFGVYNEFYTHTTHVCFFLNHEMWQAETESTIKHLYKASTRMKEQLLEASEMQNIVLQKQKEGLEIQNHLLNHGLKLEDVIQNSAETVNTIVSDFKESARDQKELLFQIFSYIRTFQNWIIGEVSWLQSILYYIVTCILSALFSASKKTADARISLFTILSLNIVIERMLVKYCMTSENHFNEDKIQLLHATWMIRKCALFLCLITLFHSYFFHKDEHLENYRALRRIEHRLDDLQELNPALKTNHVVRCSKRLALRRLKNSCKEDLSSSTTDITETRKIPFR